jgi:hypothetical protein
MGEIRNAYHIFVEKPEGKRSLEWPPKHRGDNNIGMDLRDIG